MRHWTRGAQGLAAAVALAGFGGVALARGLDMDLGSFFAPSWSYSPPPASVTYESEPVRHHARHAVSAPRSYGQAVCVRLCDGFFFPSASAAGGDATCAAQCPDAPTAMYTMPGDRIEDAYASTGASYSKLPVANRYQKTTDNTCTCHRETVASATRAREILHDATLRKGDVVMTPDGFRVYEGDAYGPTESHDFVALSKAGNLAKGERAELAAMEHTSAGSPAPAAPDLVAARPKLKGNVTVDDGTVAASR